MDGESISPGSGGHLITYSSATGTNLLTTASINQNGASPSVFLQTGGMLELNSVYIASNRVADPNYTISGGSLFVHRILAMAWNNSPNVAARFLQTGGSVRVGGAFGEGLQMALKASGQSSTYDLRGGDFEAYSVVLGVGSANSDTVFNQGPGTTAVINSYLRLGDMAGTTGRSIYNLGGGTLTIENDHAPIRFSQPVGAGHNVYFNFNGDGELNLKGAWDFDRLTASVVSDFRVGGEPATRDTLNFEELTIENEVYTRIFVGDAIEIKEVHHDEVTKEITLTWGKTRPGESYGIYWTSDQENYQMIEPIVPAHGSGDETSYGPFANPAPNEENLSIRVGEPDTEDPTLDRRTTGSGQEIMVSFSEAMNPGPVMNLSNYHLEEIGGARLALASVTLGERRETATLTTVRPMTVGLSYTLTINNLTDLAGRPLAPDTETTFTIAPPPPKTPDLHAYLIGNSFTGDSEPDGGLSALAAQQSRNLATGFHIRYGSPLHAIRGSPKVANSYSKAFGRFRDALSNHHWDAVSLQAFYKNPGEGFPQSTMQTDIDSVLSFIEVTRQNPANSDTKFYIYQSWATLGGAIDETAYQTRWETPSIDEPATWTNHTREYFEDLVNRLRLLTDAEIYLIPIGEVMFELDRRLRAGAVPGINDVRDLMRDRLHVDEGLGTFLVGLTVYATLYGTDPDGIVKPVGYYDGNNGLYVQELYDAYYDAVWEVVSAHPHTGVLRENGANEAR